MILKLKTKKAVSTPQVAIIIPVFKHSVLVSEAISCALAQETSFPVVTVIVNDGCKFAETDQVCREFALAHPQEVFYVYRQNGGLSAARNTGIDFALEAWPSIKAIYLLDADNRISKHTIEKVYHVLEDQAAIGWVYPTINMFGQSLNGEYRGDYSILRHLSTNTCEAGSLVRREVFDAGCRYDESMKLGFEDWEFWWQALDAGFRGRHCPEFGFQYRKRPESMLKNSERDSQGIIDYMQRKHRSLFAHDAVLRTEHEEAPRYAIFLSDTGKVVLTSDPNRMERQVSLSDFVGLISRALLAPSRYHRPNFLVFLNSNTLKILKAYKLLHWVFWRLEASQEDYNFSSVSMNISYEHERFVVHENNESTSYAPGKIDHISMTNVNIIDACLKDEDDTWIKSLLTPNPMPSVFKLQIDLPDQDSDEAILSAGSSLQLISIFHELQNSTRGLRKNQQLWNWHEEYFPARHALFQDARNAMKTKAIYPFIGNSKQKHVGFTLPIVEFGGVEKIALNVAKVFHDNGWTVHLFIFGTRMLKLPDWADVFETINFFYDPKMSFWNGTKYFGSVGEEWSQSGDSALALGLLSFLDVIVNFHTSPLHGLVGMLRRSGVKTVVRSEVHDITPWNRPCGHTYLMLGYEHAYDIVIPNSQKMTDWCHAMGIPENKLVPVPNACGYPVESSVIERILERRKRRPKDQKLRVLYIGRFDRQKGLDRLVSIVAKSLDFDLPIDWRLVGKSVVAGENTSEELQTIAHLIEPPALTTQALNNVFEWADVFLLPSYWEGLPLTVIEAMRLGVVVCTSNVGAVEEVVTDGKTGFLVPSLRGDAYVEYVINILKNLVDYPQDIIDISTEAALSVSNYSWEKSANQLMSKLDSVLT